VTQANASENINIPSNAGVFWFEPAPVIFVGIPVLILIILKRFGFQDLSRPWNF